MAMTAGRQWLIGAIGAGVAGVVLVSVAVVGLIRISNFNQDLAAGRYAAAAGDGSPEGVFVSAYQLQLNRDYDAAIRQYARLENSTDAQLRRRVRYNMATLYLQRALDMRQSDNSADEIPLVELAKYHYKVLLRSDPMDWPAKFNLEQALKLSPELLEQEMVDDVMPERSPYAAGAITVDRELP